jgi:hypothetical protein
MLCGLKGTNRKLKWTTEWMSSSSNSCCCCCCYKLFIRLKSGGYKHSVIQENIERDNWYFVGCAFQQRDHWEYILYKRCEPREKGEIYVLRGFVVCTFHLILFRLMKVIPIGETRGEIRIAFWLEWGQKLYYCFSNCGPWQSTKWSVALYNPYSNMRDVLNEII